jgi:hypothetical protein
LVGQCNRDLQTVTKAIREREAAQKELEVQRQRLQGMVGKSLDSQQGRIQKAMQDLGKAQKTELDIGTKIQSGPVASLHSQFSEFDSKRLRKLKHALQEFEAVRKKRNEGIDEGTVLVNGKMAIYDSDDRSARYVSRVFDASNTNLTEGDVDVTAIAISDYRSEEPRDLQFLRGDRIHVLMQHKSGWWEGELNGKKGLFPKSFVMIPGISEPKNDQIEAVFLVMNDHKPMRGGDLELLSGDLVYVDYVSKGRCSGTNLRDNVRGYFSIDVLEKRI